MSTTWTTAQIEEIAELKKERRRIKKKLDEEEKDAQTIARLEKQLELDEERTVRKLEELRIKEEKLRKVERKYNRWMNGENVSESESDSESESESDSELESEDDSDDSAPPPASNPRDSLKRKEVHDEDPKDEDPKKKPKINDTTTISSPPTRGNGPAHEENEDTTTARKEGGEEEETGIDNKKGGEQTRTEEKEEAEVIPTEVDDEKLPEEEGHGGEQSVPNNEDKNEKPEEEKIEKRNPFKLERKMKRRRGNSERGRRKNPEEEGKGEEQSVPNEEEDPEKEDLGEIVDEEDNVTDVMAIDEEDDFVEQNSFEMDYGGIEDEEDHQDEIMEEEEPAEEKEEERVEPMDEGAGDPGRDEAPGEAGPSAPRKKNRRKRFRFTERRTKTVTKKEIFSKCLTYAAKAIVHAVVLKDEDEVARLHPQGAQALRDIAATIEEDKSLSCTLSLENPAPGQFPPEVKEFLLRHTATKSITIEKKLPPRLTFCSKVCFNYAEVTGEKVVQRIADSKRVFGEPDFPYIKSLFKEIGEGRIEANTRHFTGLRDQPEGFLERWEAHSLPVAIYDVVERSERTENQIKAILDSASLCIFRNFAAAYGIDYEAFTAEALTDLLPNLEVDIRRQLPQSTRTTHSYSGPQMKPWVMATHHHMLELKKFMDHRHEIQKMGVEARAKIFEDANHIEGHLKELEGKLSESVLPGPFIGREDQDPADYTKPGTYLPTFATNLNIVKEEEKERFRRARAEIDKLPECLKPNGAEDLMRFGDEIIPGLNQAQAYLKMPTVRTTAHWEIQGAGSINLNVGPGTCLWISCPMEFFDKMDRLIRNKKASWTQSAVWPIVADLKKAGISVQVYEQKAGDMVYVGFGTPHWVQSVGFADNISWNIVVSTVNQLATAALIHDYHVAEPKSKIASEPIMPLETIIWNMVIRRKEMDMEMKRVVKSMLMRSLANATKEQVYSVDIKVLVKEITEVEGVPAVARCGDDECTRVLFNFIPYLEDGRIICFQCLSELKNAEIKHVVRRYKIEELVELFNSVGIE
uniref:JmjC domain-containing protein n=1 Tax=Caenorhabditis tropicalis TaxID=1561998 RepID=A0A1I7TRL7_9PELO